MDGYRLVEPRKLSRAGSFWEISAAGELVYKNGAGIVRYLSTDDANEKLRLLPIPTAGMQLWLDASAITGLSDNDPVPSWDDMSGNGNDASQGTGAARPTYKTSILNSLPVVRFDGSDDQLVIASGLLDDAPGATVAVVFATSTEQENKYIISFPKGTMSNGFDLRPRGEDIFSTVVSTAPDAVFTRADAAVEYDDGNGHIVVASFNPNLSSAQHKLYFDGALKGTRNNAGATVENDRGEVVIGSFSTAFAAHYTGDIAAIIVYNRALPDDELTILHDYLAAKWGVTLS